MSAAKRSADLRRERQMKAMGVEVPDWRGLPNAGGISEVKFRFKFLFFLFECLNGVVDCRRDRLVRNWL